MRRNEQLAVLEEAAGIYFPGAMDFLPRLLEKMAADGAPVYGGLDWTKLANDAQPSLITNANAGIPAFLTTWVDPKLIEVLLTPNQAVKILGGETRKGTWLDETAMFPMVESTGQTASYGDFSTQGRAGVNTQFENRQSYLYQIFTEWGDREMERMGRAKIDWAGRLNISAAISLNKFQNNSYFYGISGLALYGLLNDPSLSAPLTPGLKAAGGTSWQNATPTEILADVQALFAELQVQTGSNLEIDTPMTLALHSVSEVYTLNANQFGISAVDMLKKAFPALRIVQAPQYLSGGVYSCQLIVNTIDGQMVAEPCFNEKMRAHRVIPADSSFRQKKTQGTWGCIIYMPIGIGGMAGI